MKRQEFTDAERINEDILYEMSNFNWNTTGLPTDIIVWTRTDPLNHGHNVYRVKITKDNKWAAIFSVGSSPKMRKNINNSLTLSDQQEILNWIQKYYPLIISHINGKIDTAEFSIEVKKIRGSK